jgi:hypothetical protein
MPCVRPSDVESVMVTVPVGDMMGCQVCLDDCRFSDVVVDVGGPVVHGRWKNFRKRRKLVRRVRSCDFVGLAFL